MIQRLTALLLSMLLVFQMTGTTLATQLPVDDVLTSGAVTGVTQLEDEVSTQRVPVGTSQDDLVLPPLIEASVEIQGLPEQEGSTEAVVLSLPVSWMASPVYDSEEVGGYRFLPTLPDGFSVEEGVALPEIVVVVEASASDTLTLEPDSFAVTTFATSDEITTIEFEAELLRSMVW